LRHEYRIWWWSIWHQNQCACWCGTLGNNSNSSRAFRGFANVNTCLFSNTSTNASIGYNLLGNLNQSFSSLLHQQQYQLPHHQWSLEWRPIRWHVWWWLCRRSCMKQHHQYPGPVGTAALSNAHNHSAIRQSSEGVANSTLNFPPAPSPADNQRPGSVETASNVSCLDHSASRFQACFLSWA